MDREQIEVLIVEDHLAVRKGLELLLDDRGMHVAGVAGELGEARALLERRRCDVALIDLHLGNKSAIGLVEEVLGRSPDAPIVLYTGFTGPGAELETAMRVGARGFVLKASPPARLIEALCSVAAGGTFVDPDLAQELSAGARLSGLSELSPREHEVLSLLADGLSGQAIGARLHVSPDTVRTHVRNATTKMGARTRVQAVAMMMRARGSG